MKWLSAPAYLRRLLGAPVSDIPQDQRVEHAAPICMLVDASFCCAAIAAGASVQASQLASYVAAAVLFYRLDVRPRTAAVAGSSRWTLLATFTVVTVLALVLRSGVLELFLRLWDLPPYAAVVLAVICSGLVMRAAYSLCADTQSQAVAVGVAGYAFLLRLVYSAQVELMPEEAYYWNYSRHLDIGYLDHPPLVAWLIRAGTGLFGNTEFGVRFGALCCGVIASFFIFRLTRNLFGERVALLALIFAQVLPYFFLSGMLMTPDAPLTAAWAAALYFLERALVGGRSSAWLWAGLSMGLGLLSKYSIGLVGVAAFAFMLVDAPSRRWFLRWEPYAAFLVAIAVFSPAIVWNAQHDWASFAFQTSRRLAEQPRFSLHKLIGAAILLMTPTGLLTIAAVLARRKRHLPAMLSAGTLGRQWRFLQIALFVPLAVFFLFSLRHEIKLDWTGAPWEAALPAMAFGIAESRQWRGSRWIEGLRSAWPATVVCMLLLYAGGLYYLVLGIPGIGYTEHTELLPVGWRDFGRQVDAVAGDVRATYGEDSLVVGMDRYAIASELAFYSDDRAKSVAGTSTAHLFDDMGLMYELWFPSELQSGRTLLLVAWNSAALDSGRLKKHVDELGPLREGALMRDGHAVRRYYFRVVHGYHSRPTGD